VRKGIERTKNDAIKKGLEKRGKREDNAGNGRKRK
jgi:hypothetical protein